LTARLGIWFLLAQACAASGVPPSPPPILSAPTLDAVTPTVQAPLLLYLTSEQGKFDVWLPVSEGMLEYTLTTQIVGQSIECHVTFSRLDFAYAVVEYCDLPPETMADVTPEQVLALTRNDLMRPFKAEVATERPSLAEDTFPSLTLAGRVDMRGFGDDGAFDARIILVDKRVYIFMMAASDGNICGCSALKSQVVDSFHVAPDLSIPYEPTP
jgi:hypothetical protein